MQRKKRGLTIGEAAQKLGISRSSLSAYENDHLEISLLLLIKMTELYDCDIFDLCGVHTGMKGVVLDINPYEILKYHARFVIKSKMKTERSVGLENFPDEYYEKAYRDYLNELVATPAYNNMFDNLKQSAEADKEGLFD